MYLEPGEYSIVAYKAGFSPACSDLVVANNEDYEISFTLSTATMGSITCNVTTNKEAVTIQFLQELYRDGLFVRGHIARDTTHGCSTQGKGDLVILIVCHHKI